MEIKDVKQSVVDECIAKTYKIEIEIGEGRTLDNELLQRVEKIALSSLVLVPGEQEFFMNILKQPNIGLLEDWQLVRCIRLAEKANVKITFLGKPHLQVKSDIESQRYLIAKLRESYLQGEATKFRHVFDDKNHEIDISQVYVNLAIVLEKSQQKKDKRINKEKKETKLFQDRRMISSYEQIYGKKKNFPLSQLFNLLKEEDAQKEWENQQLRRILIEGWAGIGKTVLCQYLVKMWAIDTDVEKNRWWLNQTKVVIWIRLRNLVHYDPKDCRLGVLIRRECFGVTDTKDPRYPSVDQIEADLAALGEDVVFLLDGFDEVAECYHEIEKGTQLILTARSELLQNELLGERHRHRVILTSRPSRVEQIEGKFDRHLETIGFKDKDIERYITNYFQNFPKNGELLLETMKHNSNLWGISHIPVNLALICLVWKEREKGRGNEERKDKSTLFQMISMTTLYNEAILWLLRRDWVKHPTWNEIDQELKRKRLEELGVKLNVEEILDEDRKWRSARELDLEDFESKFTVYSNKLNILEELAWNSQISIIHSLLIPGTKILQSLEMHYGRHLKDEECKEILLAIRTLGLLESQYDNKSIPVKENYYYFPHLTFQEYFSAKYWVRKYCSEKQEDKETAENLFKQFKYHPRFEIIWWFVSGLLRNHTVKLNEFFVMMSKEPREFIGLKHTGILIRCVEESGLALEENDQADRFMEEVSNWIVWSISICDVAIKPRVLYDALNQSRGVYTHKKVVAVLMNHLSISGMRRNEMLRILQMFQEVPPIKWELIESVWKLLSCNDYLVSEKCHEVLRKISYSEVELKSEHTAALVELVTKHLQDEYENVRMTAIAVLPSLPWDQIVGLHIPILLNDCQTKLYDRNRHTRLNAAQILRYLPWIQISDDKLLNSILDRMRIDRDYDVRSTFIMTLPYLPWRQCTEKQNLLLINFCVDVMQSRDRNLQLTFIEVLPYLPWEQYSEEYSFTLYNVIEQLIQERNIFGELSSEEAITIRKYWEKISKWQLNILVRNSSKSLQDQDIVMRIDAIKRLPHLPWKRLSNEQRQNLIDLYVECLNEKDENIRTTAIIVLSRITLKNIPEWHRVTIENSCKTWLSDTNKMIRRTAFDFIFRLILEQPFVGDFKNRVKFIVERFYDQEFSVQLKWYSMLPHLTSVLTLEESRPIVIRYIEKSFMFAIEHDLSVRYMIMSNLSKELFSEDQIQQLIDRCIQILLNSNNFNRGDVISVLPNLPWERFSQEQNKTMLLNIENIFFDKDSILRRKAVEILPLLPWKRFTGEQIKVLVMYVQEMLLDEDWEVQCKAIEVLPQLPLDQCMNFQEIIGNIIESLQSVDDRVNNVAIDVLSKLNWESCLETCRPILVNYCVDRMLNSNWEERKSVIDILNKISWWRFFEQDWTLPGKYSQGIFNLFLIFCYYSGLIFYIDNANHYIQGFNLLGHHIIIDNKKLYENVQTSLNAIRKDIQLPLYKIQNQPVEPLSQSRDRISFQVETPTIFEFHVEEKKMQLQVHFLSQQRVKILLNANHSWSITRLCSLRILLISFLKTKFEAHLIKIVSSGGTSFDVIGNKATLMKIKESLDIWLKNDFPDYFLHHHNDSTSTCIVC